MTQHTLCLLLNFRTACVTLCSRQRCSVDTAPELMQAEVLLYPVCRRSVPTQGLHPLTCTC